MRVHQDGWAIGNAAHWSHAFIETRTSRTAHTRTLTYRSTVRSTAIWTLLSPGPPRASINTLPCSSLPTNSLFLPISVQFAPRILLTFPSSFLFGLSSNGLHFLPLEFFFLLLFRCRFLLFGLFLQAVEALELRFLFHELRVGLRDAKFVGPQSIVAEVDVDEFGHAVAGVAFLPVDAHSGGIWSAFGLNDSLSCWFVVGIGAR